ncbi:MAG: hypothetical protein M1568_02490 [Acidobacteria bacterium]|nr:hypothetical protein [Acidobacteriota bacterium]
MCGFWGAGQGGKSICTNCGTAKEFTGWHFGIYEKMAIYQTHYGLKPIGNHAPMARKLFEPFTVTCETCGGRGLCDLNGDTAYEVCKVCRGLGSLFAGPLNTLFKLRQEVLNAYPDAAASAASAPVLDVASGAVVSRESAKLSEKSRGGRKDEPME